MKRAVLVFAFVGLSGCTSLNDVRSGPPMGVGQSSKPVDEIAGCVAQKWGGRMVTVNSVPIKGGVTVSVSAQSFGATKVWNAADIVDLGDHRELTLRVAGRHRPQGLQELAPCL